MEELFAVIGVFTLPLTVGFAVAWWIKRAELRMRGRLTRLLASLRPTRIAGAPESWVP